MKSLKTYTAACLIALFTAANASAACPTIYFQNCCGTYWYKFDLDSSCLTVNNASSATLWSCGVSGYDFGTGYGDATWTFTVPQNDANYTRLSNWDVAIFVDFDSPQQTFYDSIQASVTVTHNGSPVTTTIVSLYGSSASTQACTRYDASFSATNGDTISIRYSTVKWGTGATVRASVPTVFNTL